MLAPKFSIRQMLIATVFLAFLCAVIASASRGNAIGFGLVIAIVFLIVPFTIYGMVYLLARLFSIASSIGGYVPVENRSADYQSHERQPFQFTASPISTSPISTSPAATNPANPLPIAFPAPSETAASGQPDSTKDTPPE